MDRPPHSMTGVGLAAGASEVGELRVEVRTVNARTLQVKLRLPAGCGGYEAALEEAVRRRVQRGTVTLIAERLQQVVPLPDHGVVRAVAADLMALAAELGLPPPGLADVVQLAAAAARGEAATSRPLPPLLQGLVAQALADLQRHREQEGAATVRAIEAELAGLDGHLQAAALRAPAVAAAYRERLLQRVQEFAREHGHGEVIAADLVREVAVYGDRVDVAEELQRLRAHLAEVHAVLARGGEVGRRLEFLLQELLRETNTLGSKSPDVAMAHAAVAMKSAIERLREQAANLE